MLNLPAIHHPPEVVEKKGYEDTGKCTCLEMVLWGKWNICCQDISSSVHKNQQGQLNAQEAGSSAVCCLEGVPWGKFQSPIVRIPAVQVCSVRTANRNHQLWHDPAETARPPLNQQESAGDTGEVLCGASLNRVKISEDEDLRPTEHCRASYASPPSPTLRPIIRSQTSRVLTGVFPSMSLASAEHHVSLS